MRRALPLFLAGALLSGCAVKPEFIRSPYSPPPSIAVLPFDNQSNSVEAPVFMQKLVRDALASGGYAVQSFEDTTARLREAGITQGGQEKSKTPAELAAILRVSAVVYGRVTSFSYKTLGFYQSREVGMHAELVASDGTKLWAQTMVATRREVNTDAAKSLGDFAWSLGGQLVVKAIEKMVSHPLYPEMLRCVHDLTMTLPSVRNPGRGVGKYTKRGYAIFWRDIAE